MGISLWRHATALSLVDQTPFLCLNRIHQVNTESFARVMAKRYQERLARSSGFSNKQFKSDFGLKILKKFGWEEGRGLGKNEDGREECIQQLRRDGNAGLGSHKQTSSEHEWQNWWSDVFNTAAKRIAEKTSESRPRAKAWDFADPESSDSDTEDDEDSAPRVTAIKSASRMAGKLRRVLRQEQPQAVPAKEFASTPMSSSSATTKKRKFEEHVVETEEKCGTPKKRITQDGVGTTSSSERNVDEESRVEQRQRKKAEKRKLQSIEEADLPTSPEMA